MSDAPAFRTFFGDAQRDFRLTPDLITELERRSGRGVGGLCRDLFASNFRHAEILETIRLALIGGGESPEDADALVKTYAAPAPVMTVYPLAVAILEMTMFGQPAKKGKRK